MYESASTVCASPVHTQTNSATIYSLFDENTAGIRHFDNASSIEGQQTTRFGFGVEKEKIQPTFKKIAITGVGWHTFATR